MKKVDWLVILFIIISSIFTLKDLYIPGLYTSHDGLHQIPRLYYFNEAVRDGQFPVRWAKGLLNGYGYPLFIFSYHMPWYIAEPFVILGFSIIDSLKLTFLLGFIISGITMYIFQKDIFNRLAGFTGTILYLYAPYRFSNIFVRAAIGDATSFIFVPLIFLAIWNLRKKFSWGWIVVGSFSFSGLLLSHVMVFLLFLVPIVSYCLVNLFNIENKKSYLFSCVITFISGLSLSSYYLIPSIIERSYTQFQSLMSQIFVGSYFLKFNELIYSKWGYGTIHSKEGGMSFQIGIPQWLVIIISCIFIIIAIKKRKRYILNITTFLNFVYFFLIFWWSIFLMMPISLFIWKAISQIVLIDFPWRVLSVTIFSISICTGFLVYTSKKKGILFSLILIILSIYSNRNHIRINQIYNWDIPFILKLEKTTNTYAEYTPKWVNQELVKNIPKSKIEFLQGKSDVTINSQKTNLLDFKINIPKEGIIRINTIYYPGWNVYVNNNKTDINYENNGLIEFSLPKGQHQIQVKFEETVLRKLSNYLSIITLAILSLVLIYFHRKRV